MSTILTDDEIAAAIAHLYAGPDVLALALPDELYSARAVEAAVLAKLAQQEPVAWMCSDPGLSLKGYSRFSPRCEGAWNIPVYTHPAPQQADQIDPFTRKAPPDHLTSTVAAQTLRLLAAAPEAPAVARDKLKVLADEYAARCSEFARKLASGKPDDSMSPIAVSAGDARMALHLAIDAAPEAPAQNGHLADDERVAALCTLSYAAGMKAGWNYCASEDNEGFERSQKSVGEAIRILKAHRAAAEAPAQAEPLCPNCGGSGEQAYVVGRGPDAHDEFGPCSICDGVGVQPRASAVDERAAFEAWLGIKPCEVVHEFAWAAWLARAALAQKGGK